MVERIVEEWWKEWWKNGGKNGGRMVERMVDGEKEISTSPNRDSELKRGGSAGVDL
jgi:hypothetical protein